MAFEIPYVYEYIITLWRPEAQVILSHINPKVCGTGQREVRHRK
jgi:hypothetical protein